MSVAYPTTLADTLSDLGGIAADRVLMHPAPGSATIDDHVAAARSNPSTRFELVDGTLIEKVMGYRQSLLAAVLIQWLRNFLDGHNLGLVTGPDGFVRLFGRDARAPDVMFVSWDRLPGGRVPEQAYPSISPDFVIEVLSDGNTYGEMSRKRRDFFNAGCLLFWIVDPNDRTVTAYTDQQTYRVHQDDETIDAGSILPGFTVDLARLFAELDKQRPDPSV